MKLSDICIRVASGFALVVAMIVSPLLGPEKADCVSSGECQHVSLPSQRGHSTQAGSHSRAPAKPLPGSGGARVKALSSSHFKRAIAPLLHPSPAHTSPKLAGFRCSMQPPTACWISASLPLRC